MNEIGSGGGEDSEFYCVHPKDVNWSIYIAKVTFVFRGKNVQGETHFLT